MKPRRASVRTQRVSSKLTLWVFQMGLTVFILALLVSKPGQTSDSLLVQSSLSQKPSDLYHNEPRHLYLAFIIGSKYGPPIWALSLCFLVWVEFEVWTPSRCMLFSTHTGIRFWAPTAGYWEHHLCRFLFKTLCRNHREPTHILVSVVECSLDGRFQARAQIHCCRSSNLHPLGVRRASFARRH